MLSSQSKPQALVCYKDTLCNTSLTTADPLFQHFPLRPSLPPLGRERLSLGRGGCCPAPPRPAATRSPSRCTPGSSSPTLERQSAPCSAQSKAAPRSKSSLSLPVPLMRPGFFSCALSSSLCSPPAAKLMRHMNVTFHKFSSPQQPNVSCHFDGCLSFRWLYLGYFGLQG